ncbi:8264_t:CDS:2 [Gigaspora rosea]|nr:8264_t:CDS:2 [Gigaspora rosea]
MSSPNTIPQNSELTQEIGEEKAENSYKKNSPEPEEQEAMIVEQDVSIPKVNEEVVKTENSTGLYTAPTITTNKENIPLGSPNINTKSNEQVTNSMSCDQQISSSEKTTDNMQTEDERGFTEVSYKKKAKNKKVLTNRRENQGPYKKSKTSQ